MSKLFTTIKHEFYHLLPAWIYFFMTFQAVAFTQSLVLKTYDIHISTFVSATIGSLLVAKVILVAGFLPFLEPFPEIPLVHNVLWKTLVFWLLAMVFQILEQVLFHGGLSSFFTVLSQPHFWMVQFWLIILLFLWCNIRAIVHLIGREEALRVYLGIRSIR